MDFFPDWHTELEFLVHGGSPTGVDSGSDAARSVEGARKERPSREKSEVKGGVRGEG
jgi:hypothetical protein